MCVCCVRERVLCNKNFSQTSQGLEAISYISGFQIQGLALSYLEGLGCRSELVLAAVLSSGALRAPELKTASGTPARFVRRLRRKIFLIFVSMFLCFG